MQALKSLKNPLFRGAQIGYVPVKQVEFALENAHVQIGGKIPGILGIPVIEIWDF